MRMGRIFEEFGLVWIEEPLDAYDAEGHAAARPGAGHPDRHRRDAGQRGRARPADRGRRGRHRAARRPPDRRHHPVPQAGRAGRVQAAGDRPALRHGDPLPPRRGVPDRALGRALRLAGPAVQRAPGDPRRPDVGVRPPGSRLHPQRAGPGLDRRHRRVRSTPSAARCHDPKSREHMSHRSSRGRGLPGRRARQHGAQPERRARAVLHPQPDRADRLRRAGSGVGEVPGGEKITQTLRDSEPHPARIQGGRLPRDPEADPDHLRRPGRRRARSADVRPAHHHPRGHRGGVGPARPAGPAPRPAGRGAARPRGPAARLGQDARLPVLHRRSHQDRPGLPVRPRRGRRLAPAAARGGPDAGEDRRAGRGHPGPVRLPGLQAEGRGARRRRGGQGRRPR